MLHKSASGMDQGGFCLFLSEEGRKDFIKSAVARQGTYFLSLSLSLLELLHQQWYVQAHYILCFSMDQMNQ